VYTIDKATIKDATTIHKLVNNFADHGQMLARSLAEIYENLRDFYVIRGDNGEVIACAALHISWADLAEVKSLAVSEERHRQGLGEMVVKACLEDAKSLQIPTVFCLTYKPAFFAKCGFHQVEKNALPHKIWGECYRCPKFPNCDETAMMLSLTEANPA